MPASTNSRRAWRQAARNDGWCSQCTSTDSSMPAAAAESAKVGSDSRAAIAASCSADNVEPFGCALRLASLAAPAVTLARALFGTATGIASLMANSRASNCHASPAVRCVHG